MIKASVACELLHQVTFVVLKFSLFYSVNTVIAKLKHFCEAAYLRRCVDNV
jgi:hypothetical protein